MQMLLILVVVSVAMGAPLHLISEHGKNASAEALAQPTIKLSPVLIEVAAGKSVLVEVAAETGKNADFDALAQPTIKLSPPRGEGPRGVLIEVAAQDYDVSSDSWDNKCPEGYGGPDITQCEAIAKQKGWGYGNGFNDGSYPKECILYNGNLYYNFHENGSYGATTSTTICIPAAQMIRARFKTSESDCTEGLTNECPDGYATIGTQTLCKLAASALYGTMKLSTPTNETRYQIGCYYKPPYKSKTGEQKPESMWFNKDGNLISAESVRFSMCEVLPSGWKQLRTSTGQAYYWNTVSGASQWGKPDNQY